MSGNVHEVAPGVLYRSGQLSALRLDSLTRTEGIRSILNLGGDHREAVWWREETLVAASNGVVYTSLPMSAGSRPSMATMTRIAETIRSAPKPMLVHCSSGSNRSGLASAISDLAVRGRSADEAAKQLSIVYGHFPWLGSRTRAMDDAFAELAANWPSDKVRREASSLSDK